ncbi:MAG: AAA family ATPase [Bacteroidales bacterium]|nr:AAA family ATPase [Bacteroidales bacterium]
MEHPERIFKRKIYEKLADWKRTKDGQTALLIRGARRVGKSTIAEEFAKREYTSYIKVDCTIWITTTIIRSANI